MTHALATVGGAAVLVRDDRFVPLSHWGEGRSVLALLEDWAAVEPQLAAWAADEAAFAAAQDFASARVDMPYRPGQVFCTGANYKKHVVGLIMGDGSMRTAEHEEQTEEERRAKAEAMMDQRAALPPFCFIKLPSSAVGPQDDVVLPKNVQKPDWELELGVVIGKRTHRVSAAEAMDHVAGFAVVNDVTARELIFRRDGSAIGADWLAGKSFPTFLPFGPLIVPRSQVADPYDLTIRLSVNGKVYQDESTADMMTSIERQIEFLSSIVVLLPGDVICTGSPYGNGAAFGVFLQDGDVMEGSITGLGTQRNTCVAEG
ncbi:fumarylacetoacetate hydrolase family protein [Alteraurantiacibacter buctensis]|uniref:Fumarylacetoacetate hydrolase family protein n=1 Tax=Alteraurantiacibacter buctensis TaxID=1503981 RepID=A0A844YW19_9SPHN|nr:fumarylacetoacetate hydrolase family protein [Alteraurantiacibacter buctensis]MXO71031.1 fumarylacetoacetate hydrolase family protein [Alteraurantiacibacter buctensis]